MGSRKCGGHTAEEWLEIGTKHSLKVHGSEEVHIQDCDMCANIVIAMITASGLTVDQYIEGMRNMPENAWEVSSEWRAR